MGWAFRNIELSTQKIDAKKKRRWNKEKLCPGEAVCIQEGVSVKFEKHLLKKTKLFLEERSLIRE